MPNRDTLIRLLVIIITYANSVFVSAGRGKIQLADNDIYAIASFLALFISVLWGYWKNNSYTPEAKKADEYMAELKGETDEQ